MRVGVSGITVGHIGSDKSSGIVEMVAVVISRCGYSQAKLPWLSTPFETQLIMEMQTRGMMAIVASPCHLTFSPKREMTRQNYSSSSGEQESSI